MKETALSPFALLKDIEARSRSSAIGLPQKIEVRRPWSGMGFRVGNTFLVSSLREVNEVLSYPELTKVPHAKPWVKGVANVRGLLLTVLDLRGFIEGELTPINKRSRVLVVKTGELNVGLLVEQALGLRHFFDEEQVATLPAISSALAGFLLGGYRQGEQDWGVFSMNRLLDAQGFMDVAV